MTNDYFYSYTPLPRNQVARAEAVNAIIDAVVVGFDVLPAALAIKQDRVTYATDTGGANAYVIAPTHAIASYVAGARFSFKAATANTTASTVNVSALGVKSIKRVDGSALVAGDIALGALVSIQYDGTNFQLMSPAAVDVAAAAASAVAAAASASSASTSASTATTGASTATTQANTSTAQAVISTAQAVISTAQAVLAAASAASAAAVAGAAQWSVGAGTADAITGTFPTTITSVTDGMIVGVRALLANATTTPTFSPDGLTARTITKNGGAALAAGDISGVGHELLLRYKATGTKWELLNPAGGFAGTITNDSAAAGYVGEVISSTVASGAGVSLTNATAKTVTSIALTAGDWDVFGMVGEASSDGSFTQALAGSSPTNNTIGAESQTIRFGPIVGQYTSAVPIPTVRVSLAGSATYYLAITAYFSSGTCTGFGSITARRAR